MIEIYTGGEDCPKCGGTKPIKMECPWCAIKTLEAERDRWMASANASAKAASDNAALAERRRVEMFRYRAALEQLVQGINQNLGTHDHTDWELARMVERAEAVLNEE